MNLWTARTESVRGLGWAKYVWLVYLVFYFGALALQPASPRDWAISLAAVAGFLPLYFKGFRTTGPPLLAISSAIYLLGTLVMPVNPGANCFFIYAIAMVAFAWKTSVSAAWVAGMTAGIPLQAWLFGWQPVVWIPTLLVAAVIGATNIAFAQRRRYGEQLRVAQRAVEEMARIAERERIGRDLHDLLGHTLSVIVLKSELASKLASRDPERACAEIREVERISRDALAEVRKAVRGYRSEGLDDEIANAERVLVAAGVTPVLDVARIPLAPAEERALAFALREAVTNVVRHAGASCCWITVRDDHGKAIVQVHDNGRGGVEPDGSGLSGMRERLRELNGTVERDGSSGTRLVVTLPLGRTASRNAAAAGAAP